MSNDKWLMFKNYMHNELGITKDDIQQWIRDSITTEVKNVVAQAYGKFDIEEALKKAIYDNNAYWSVDKSLVKEVRRDLCHEILKHFKFSINDKEIKENIL